jgi:putative endonuclease
VYIMASTSRVLYTDSTHELRRRMYEHKCGAFPGFTRVYAVTRLVHFEVTDHIRAALERESRDQVLASREEDRVDRVQEPGMLDLAIDWFPDMCGEGPSLRSG